MRFFYDLHIHSRYAYATSKYMSVKTLTKWGLVKGLNVIGTGDFTHPKWFKEVRTELKDTSEEGVYESVHGGMNFFISGEVSNIYRKNDVTRKVHNLILLPNFEVASQVNELLRVKGKVEGDGRPIFSGYDSEDMVSDLMNISKKILVIPAHIWTPWFGLLGSKSGFDSVRECFGGQVKNIHAVETGLSSDPVMNWGVSDLDDFMLVSNSDCHSAFPHRLGREANIFDFKTPSYFELFKTLKDKVKKNFLGTVEVDPNYGKYHVDGHRKCGVSFTPKQSKELNGICPKCGGSLTIGVMGRVEDLTDRKENLTKGDVFMPKHAVNYVNILPLQEILSYVLGKGVLTKAVWNFYYDLVNKYGTEYAVLLDAPLEELKNFNHGKLLSKLIGLMRSNELVFEPGFDGVYGKIKLPKEEVNLTTNDSSEKMSLNKFF